MAAEPMSDARLAELEAWARNKALPPADSKMLELVAEIHRQRESLRNVISRIEDVRKIHQPKQDPPFSLIKHTFCSCEAYEVRTDVDGYPSISPAEYPCATVRALNGDVQ